MAHDQFIKRTLELARLGESYVHPNPAVGSVIVFDDEIIAEAFHQRCGEAHAERIAVKKAEEYFAEHDLNAEESFRKSSIYVSLEPCAHHGRTPPCSQLIIEKQFRELVFASYDPNPNVSGKGIEKIQLAGIKVIKPEELSKELQNEAIELNAAFFKNITEKKTWLTMKLAVTEDHQMISTEKWITNTEARKDVHRMRSCHQAIISGLNSVRKDDSELTVRHSAKDLGLADTKNPVRIVLCQNSEFTDAEKNKLKIFNSAAETRVYSIKAEGDFSSLSELINELYKERISKIMLETGAKLSAAFLNEGLVDEIVIYQRGEIDEDYPSILRTMQGSPLASRDDVKVDLKKKQSTESSTLLSLKKMSKLQIPASNESESKNTRSSWRVIY